MLSAVESKPASSGELKPALFPLKSMGGGSGKIAFNRLYRHCGQMLTLTPLPSDPCRWSKWLVLPRLSANTGQQSFDCPPSSRAIRR
jgi:hypothetical protein